MLKNEGRVVYGEYTLYSLFWLKRYIEKTTKTEKLRKEGGETDEREYVELH